MSSRPDVVILGLALSSAWGNGHATTYRALIKGLARHGRRVVFLERERPWYAAHRDFTRLSQCQLEFYDDLRSLMRDHAATVRDAASVIVGSFVPEGQAVIDWVFNEARGMRAFYDIDTPVTLAALAQDQCEYLDRSQVPKFDVYLSFTGGATLGRLEREFGARRAQALYCCVDTDQHRPVRAARLADLGYLGTYSADRQPRLEALLLEPARRLPARKFVIGGAQYPEARWPENVRHRSHVAPGDHAHFYSSQRFTLNLTRDDMIAAGHAPSVRLFEAAACGVPILSDAWPGLEEFFEPRSEIRIVGATGDVLAALDLDERARRAMSQAARARVLAQHTGEMRAAELAGILDLGAPHARRIVLTHGDPHAREART